MGRNASHPTEFLVVGDFSTVVIRKRIKNLHLRVVEPGVVKISAPWWMPQRTIRDFVLAKQDWITARLQDFSQNQRSPEQDALDRDAVRAAVPALLERWQPVLGVTAAGFSVRTMKTLWGSCTPRSATLRLNGRLAAYPPECLEYVVVHELVHLLEPSHNARFHTLMDRYLPDWQARRDLLKPS